MLDSTDFAPAPDSRDAKAALTNNYTVAAAVLILVVSCVLLAVETLAERQVRLTSVHLPAALVRLERSIGYGGLIHSFKNAILRPDESEYLDSARVSAAEALAALDELDAILASVGVSANRDEARAVILSYLKRLETIEDLHSRGRTAREIDAQVRVSDDKALAQIVGFSQQAANVIDGRLTNLSQVSRVLFAVVIISFVVMVFSLREMRHARVGASEFRRQAEKERMESEKAGQARKEAEAANDELKSFAYAMSHDLKAPANTLALLLREISHGEASPEEKGEMHRMCASTVHRMQSLISDLMGYAGLIGAHPNEEAVRLSEVVAAVRSDLRADIRESGAMLDVGPLPTIVASRTQVHMLFQNLIGNAIKYRRPDFSPAIRIRASRDRANDRIMLSFSDNGIGIASEYQARIFDMFRRLHRHDELPGNGLGLTLCRRIALNLGGSISVHSRIGEGSDFVVSLPAERAVRA